MFLRCYAVATHNYEVDMLEYEAAMVRYKPLVPEGEAIDDGLDVPKMPVKPQAVKMRAEIGSEFWKLETDALREEVTSDAELIHAEEMSKWEEVRVALKTPLQFHQ